MMQPRGLFPVLLLLSLLFSLLLSSANSQSCSAGPELKRAPRIVGGSSPAAGEYPFMAAIYRKDQFVCTAVLVQSRYVMTAAHCFLTSEGLLNTNITDLTVRVNSYDLSGPLSTMVTMEVAYVIISPTFNNSVFTTTRKSDIALLRFDSALNDILPVNVAQSSGPLPSGQGLVLGWGASTIGGGMEPELKQAKVSPATGAECVTYADYFSDAHICTFDENAGPCTQDDGAPLLYLVDGVWTIYGVVTESSGCGAPGTFGVYTKVSSYYEFLYGKNVGRADGKLFGGFLCSEVTLITSSPASTTRLPGLFSIIFPAVLVFLFL